MSFFDDGRWVDEYSEEEKEYVFNALSKPLYKKDVFIVRDNDVMEFYINYDVEHLPQAMWYFYDFDHVIKCYEQANGDPDKFFSYITNNYFSDVMIIADDEDIAYVRRTFMLDWDAEGLTKESMETIISKVRSVK